MRRHLPDATCISLLVTQPRVISDPVTARGFGLSVNGQRPSSNFLVDGLENT
jgi:hypothetical protein